jgi:hypothetical protein
MKYILYSVAERWRSPILRSVIIRRARNSIFVSIGYRHDRQQRYECSSRGKISCNVLSLELVGESLNVIILL